jgi:hypothetical protein
VSEETEAHREGLSMVAQPGRRLMVAVARPGRRATAVPGVPHGGRVGWVSRMAAAAASKESRNGGAGVKRDPSGGSVRQK